MKDENVINLVDYIEQKRKVETSSSLDISNKNTRQTSFLTKRIYSFIIDIACIFTVHTALITSFAIFVSDFFQVSSMSLKVQLLSITLPYQLGIFLTAYMGYFMFTQTVMDGQTIGQKVYGLRVCDNKGQSVSNFKISFLRSTAYLSYYLGSGIFQIFYFSSKEKKSFADVLSKTNLTDSNKTFEDSDVVTIEISSLDKVA